MLDGRTDGTLSTSHGRELDACRIPHAVPDALGNLHRQFVSLELLIDQPHSNHEFLFRQEPDLPVVHELPHLFQHRGWKAATGPHIAYDQVEHALACWRPLFASNRSARIASVRCDEETPVRCPYAFVAPAFFLCDLLPPSLAIALVMFVRMFAKQPVSSVGVGVIHLRHAAKCVRHSLGWTGSS